MKNMNDALFDGVGLNSYVDHVCIQVAHGMLIGATTFFERLGFVENKERRIQGSWGSARFLSKDGSIPIQLTESSNLDNPRSVETHIAVAVEDPHTVVSDITDWLHRGGEGEGFEIELAGQDNIFVYIPRLLTVPIEFVPL